jgi:hypothetical protein
MGSDFSIGAGRVADVGHQLRRYSYHRLAGAQQNCAPALMSSIAGSCRAMTGACSVTIRRRRYSEGAGGLRPFPYATL